eukprot:PhM_4_TR16819/c0_g1_i4/m.104728
MIRRVATRPCPRIPTASRQRSSSRSQLAPNVAEALHDTSDMAVLLSGAELTPFAAPWPHGSVPSMPGCRKVFVRGRPDIQAPNQTLTINSFPAIIVMSIQTATSHASGGKKRAKEGRGGSEDRENHGGINDDDN